MDLIKYILLISPPGTGLHFTDIIVVCAQKTADVNVIRRFQRTPASALNPDADAKESLEILLLIAYDCIQAEAELAKFWRRMRFDFVIMMLNIAQPIDELNLAIRLLRTSILEASFAMIVPPGDGTQDKSEAVVIDRLSRLLVEVPVVDNGAKPYSVVEISDLRLQVLALMQNMCDKKHSGEALATHKDLISRLVRVMNDQLAALYDYQYGHEHRYSSS